MKKIIVAAILISPLFFFFSRQKVYADDRCYDWAFTDEKGQDIDNGAFPKSINKINYNFKIRNADKDPGAKYKIRRCPDTPIGICGEEEKKTDSDGTISGTYDANAGIDVRIGKIEVDLIGGAVNPICTYNINWVEAPPSSSAECTLSLDPPQNITQDKNIKISGTLTNLKNIRKYVLYSPSSSDIGGSLLWTPKIAIRGTVTKDFDVLLDSAKQSFSANILKGWPDGQYTATAKVFYETIDPLWAWPTEVDCQITFIIPDGVIPTGTPYPTPTTPAICTADAKAKKLCSGSYESCPWCPKAKRERLGIDIPQTKPLCDQLGGQFSGKCWECQKTGGIWSAIGCLPTDFSALLKDYVFKFGTGIAGGVSFLYFLYGIFLILTSAGNAEKMEEAKQIITSALAGLLLIIFSVFLLSIIGVQILQIPGFS